MDKLINSGIHHQYQMNICYTSSRVMEFQTTDRPLLGLWLRVLYERKRFDKYFELV